MHTPRLIASRLIASRLIASSPPASRLTSGKRAQPWGDTARPQVAVGHG